MRRLTTVLFAFVLVATACSGGDDSSAEPSTTTTTSTTVAPTTTTTATPTTTTTTTTLPPLVDLEYLGAGEYDVGAATITITDEERDRPLTVEVWFPRSPEGVLDGPAHRYSFITGDYYDSPRAQTADFTWAAPGPFPLVVYSHGSGGIRFNHSDMTEVIASHGYVVVAADHTGNTAVDQVLGVQDDGERIALNRPLDVIELIDAMTAVDDPETEGWSALVDPERIAVAGHSMGGYTALAVVTGIELDIGTVTPDERIDAIIPIAPAAGFFSPDALATIEQQMLILVGTADESTPIDPNVTVLWDSSPASPAYRAEFVDAAHASFTDVCDYLEAVPSRPDANELVVEFINGWAGSTCEPPTMDIERVKELTNTLTVAFLDSVFEGGDMISAATHVLPDDLVWYER